MKISVLCNSEPGYSGDVHQVGHIGAGLHAVVYLAKYLQKLGNTVSYYSINDNPGRFDDVDFYDIRNSDFINLKEADIVLINRRPELSSLARQHNKSAKLFFYGPDRGGVEEKAWLPYLKDYTNMVLCGSYLRDVYYNTYPDDKFIAIPYGIPVDKFYPEKFTTIEKNVLFSGVISPARNINVILEAYKKAKNNSDEQAHIIGSSKLWEDSKRENKNMNSLGITEDANYDKILANAADGETFFYGALTNNQVAVEIRKHRGVFIMPTIYETCGVSIMEAQATGMPVIVSPLMACPERVVNGHTGFIVDINSDKIGKMIRFLFDQPELREKLGENARKEITRLYSWESIANKWNLLFQGKLPTIGIGITAYHNPNLLYQCLERLKRWTYMPYKIYVWDNSNNSEDEKVCKMFDGVEYETERVNKGNAYGINKCFGHFKQKGIEFVAIVSEDTLVLPGWIDMLFEKMYKTDNAGMVFFPQSYKIRDIPVSENGEISECATELFLSKTSIWEQVGKFDEGFIYYSLDSEFQQRMNYTTKYRSYLVDDACNPGFEHFHHHSTNINPLLWQQAQNDVNRWAKIQKEKYPKNWDWRTMK